MTQPQLTVVIIGGGIGGLFAANALIAHGFDVSVYEQAPALGEVGAGVFLTPNSVRQLQRVGLGPSGGAMGRQGRPRFALFPPRRRADRAGPGDGLCRAGTPPSACTAPTSSRCWRAHCRQAWCARDIAARASSRPSEVARVSFANGAVAEGDVVIAADGIHSELRPMPRRRRGRSSRLRRLSRRAAACAHSALADRSLADVARQGKTFPQLSGAIGRTHQLCRLRAGRCGNEGILVGARRSRRAAPRVRGLGPAHRDSAEPG